MLPAVWEAMQPYMTHAFGNPSSVHRFGREARVAVEDARDRMAHLLGITPAELVFTSGGTESDASALMSRPWQAGEQLATTGAEHEAVLQSAGAVARRFGVEVVTLPIDTWGRLTTEAEEILASARPALVSMMAVNNETGICHPIEAWAQRVHDVGGWLHCDAVQAVGHLPMASILAAADLTSISAHKFGGPKGVGALVVRSPSYHGLVTGGSQERRRRGGTENVAAIVGMATALECTLKNASAEQARLRHLRDTLRTKIDAALVAQIQWNTPDAADTAPHILSVSLRGTEADGEMLILGMDLEGIAVSAGSACTSGTIEPSHVLVAMGRTRSEALAVTRFSLGRTTTMADIEQAADAYIRVAARHVG